MSGEVRERSGHGFTRRSQIQRLREGSHNPQGNSAVAGSITLPNNIGLDRTFCQAAEPSVHFRRTVNFHIGRRVLSNLAGLIAICTVSGLKSVHSPGRVKPPEGHPEVQPTQLERKAFEPHVNPDGPSVREGGGRDEATGDG